MRTSSAPYFLYSDVQVRSGAAHDMKEGPGRPSDWIARRVFREAKFVYEEVVVDFAVEAHLKG